MYDTPLLHDFGMNQIHFNSDKFSMYFIVFIYLFVCGMCNCATLTHYIAEVEPFWKKSVLIALHHNVSFQSVCSHFGSFLRMTEPIIWHFWAYSMNVYWWVLNEIFPRCHNSWLIPVSFRKMYLIIWCGCYIFSVPFVAIHISPEWIIFIIWY